ncbi:hypothetical protein D3C77_452080 [compost metagenome]
MEQSFIKCFLTDIELIHHTFKALIPISIALLQSLKSTYDLHFKGQIRFTNHWIFHHCAYMQILAEHRFFQHQRLNNPVFHLIRVCTPIRDGNMIRQAAHRDDGHRSLAAGVHLGRILRVYFGRAYRACVDVSLLRKSNLVGHLFHNVRVHALQPGKIRLRTARCLIAHQ